MNYEKAVRILDKFETKFEDAYETLLKIETDKIKYKVDKDPILKILNHIYKIKDLIWTSKQRFKEGESKLKNDIYMMMSDKHRRKH